MRASGARVPAPARLARSASSEGAKPSRVQARATTLEKSGSFPPPALPGFISSYGPVRLPHPATSPSTVARVATPRQMWVSPVSRFTFPACCDHYPGRSDGCIHRLLPRPCSLPRHGGGSASATSLSRPAQTSVALRPAGSLNRPRRPLSRGFSLASYPVKPLVNYQINRQLSGWILPPLVNRALGAH